MSDGKEKDEHLSGLPDALVMDRDDNHTLIGLKVTNQWLEKNPKFLEHLMQLGRGNG